MQFWANWLNEKRQFNPLYSEHAIVIIQDAYRVHQHAKDGNADRYFVCVRLYLWCYTSRANKHGGNMNRDALFLSRKLNIPVMLVIIALLLTFLIMNTFF